jgi:type VI secretion system protein ImpJ
MKSLSRVIWSEGMHLGPHHFQAQSRYFEESFDFALSSLWFEPYGLTACKLDSDALRNGTVSIIHARGIFPDGLAFDIPGCDPVPAPLAVRDLFAPTRDALTVLLGIPARQPDGANCLLPGSDGFTARYTGETRNIPDETTGRDERTVMVARKNLHLLADSEPPGDMVMLPLTRVLREGSGRFVFDEKLSRHVCRSAPASR